MQMYNAGHSLYHTHTHTRMTTLASSVAIGYITTYLFNLLIPSRHHTIFYIPQCISTFITLRSLVMVSLIRRHVTSVSVIFGHSVLLEVTLAVNYKIQKSKK